ncbi:hypothetical protein BGZ73_008760 [Actinomortierella ambigua]|nr:hypothetical protein BGZ73_008760 [Actinomortierella ambigua]
MPLPTSTLLSRRMLVLFVLTPEERLERTLLLAAEVIGCVQETVHAVSMINRRYQQRVGRYLQRLVSDGNVTEEDRDVLNHLCIPINNNDIKQARAKLKLPDPIMEVNIVVPPAAAPDVMDIGISTASDALDIDAPIASDTMDVDADITTLASSTTEVGTDTTPAPQQPEDDSTDQTTQQVFLQSAMTSLYSKTRPRNGTMACKFISRLEDLAILPAGEVDPSGHLRQPTTFTPSRLVRSVATQMSRELERHFKDGSCELFVK